MTTLKFVLVLFFVISVGIQGKASNDGSEELQDTFVTERNEVNPQIRGVWKSIGNGYFLDARQDSILLYSYTPSFCYKEKNDYLEGLLNWESKFYLQHDTLSIYLTDYGSQTKQLQTKKDFVRHEEPIDDCLSFDQMKNLPTEKLYQLYEETMTAHFAFQQERQFDLKSEFDLYEDSIRSGKDALFNAMGAIATSTRDQHTKVIAMDGRSMQYRITPSALIVQQAFRNQDSIEDLNQYFGQYFSTNYSNITDSLLNGSGEKCLNGNIEWGWINKEIGYINIHSFAGFLGREFTRRQQIDSINTHMTRIIDALQHTEALIVDISFNFGGYDASALTIASYFTDRSQMAFSTQVYHDNTFYMEDEVAVHPANLITYTKPVYVLMSDISRSAAESFAMMMDALPNTTLCGSNTLGILSGMLGKSIGDFYTTYSNQKLVNGSGAYFEVTGLSPEIPLEIVPVSDVMNGHKNAVKKLVEIIEQR